MGDTIAELGKGEGTSGSGEMGMEGRERGRGGGEGEVEAEVGGEDAAEVSSAESGVGFRDGESGGDVGVGEAGGEAGEGDGEAGGARDEERGGRWVPAVEEGVQEAGEELEGGGGHQEGEPRGVHHSGDGFHYCY